MVDRQATEWKSASSHGWCCVMTQEKGRREFFLERQRRAGQLSRKRLRGRQEACRHREPALERSAAPVEMMVERREVQKQQADPSARVHGVEPGRATGRSGLARRGHAGCSYSRSPCSGVSHPPRGAWRRHELIDRAPASRIRAWQDVV